MTLLAYLAGDDRAHNVRLNRFGLTTHADGTTGFGGIVFDDPNGDIEVRGWQEVIVVEDECIEAPILFRGWIGDRTYSRSSEDVTYRDGLGRSIDCNLVDPNEALTFLLITGADGKRPPETHIQRIDWLLGSSYLPGVSDLGYVDRSHPRPFDEADYRGQNAQDVLSDLAAPINKAFFVYASQPDGEFGLFFDEPTSTVGTSSMSISNVIADNSAFCLYPSLDASLRRDPSSVVAKVRYKYRNGLVIENDTDTFNTFFSAAATGGLQIGFRGMQVDNDRIGVESTARGMADSLLAKFSIEEDTITVSVIVTPADVGFFSLGSRLPVKFSHLDLEGFGDFIYRRITILNVQQYITNLNYLLTMELTIKGARGNGGGGSTGPGDFPQPPPQAPTIVQKKFDTIISVGPDSGSIEMDAPPTVGNWLIAGVASRGVSISPPSGWTDHPHGQIHPGADYGRLMYRAVLPGETAFIPLATGGATRAEVWEVSGIDGTLDTSSFAGATTGTQPATIDAGTMTPTPNAPAILFEFLVMHCSDWSGNGPTTMSTPSGWTTDGEYEVTVNGDAHPNVQANSLITTQTSGSYIGSSAVAGAGFNFGGWGGLALAFLGIAGANPPNPSQDVPWEVVTMTTENGVSVGTTQFPYADRSLQVKVDGVLISTASYTETDGLCGDFALSWQIDADETVTVKYIGR